MANLVANGLRSEDEQEDERGDEASCKRSFPAVQAYPEHFSLPLPLPWQGRVKRRHWMKRIERTRY